jgi:hypothetical protein
MIPVQRRRFGEFVSGGLGEHGAQCAGLEPACFAGFRMAAAILGKPAGVFQQIHALDFGKVLHKSGLQ